MTSEELVNELKETTLELLETLSAFSAGDFNVVPFEGSWTAGQLAEHLIKSEGGLPEVLLNNTKSTERPPDQHFKMLSSVFLNFDIKLTAPEFIVPSSGPHDRETTIRTLRDIRNRLISLAGSLDLSATCSGASFPNVGEFTRLEWLFFVLCHSKRHVRQLKNILSAVDAA